MLDKDTTPDYQTDCMKCGNVPTVPLSGLCAVHTFIDVEEIESWQEEVKKFKGSRQRKLV